MAGGIEGMMSLHRSGWVKISVVALALVFALTGCSNPSQISYDKLKTEGFYVYVLPEDEITRHGWEQQITIQSFDKHCRGLTVDETYNPLEVRYVDLSATPPHKGLPKQSSFYVQLGPWAPPWVSGEAWTEIELELEYAVGRTAKYKEWPRSTMGVFLGIVFTDTFGQPVYVGSWLPLTETVSLVNELNYVGPPSDTVDNPWDCSR
jgi:hypothetical protein